MPKSISVLPTSVSATGPPPARQRQGGWPVDLIPLPPFASSDSMRSSRSPLDPAVTAAAHEGATSRGGTPHHFLVNPQARRYPDSTPFAGQAAPNPHAVAPPPASAVYGAFETDVRAGVMNWLKNRPAAGAPQTRVAAGLQRLHGSGPISMAAGPSTSILKTSLRRSWRARKNSSCDHVRHPTRR